MDNKLFLIHLDIKNTDIKGSRNKKKYQNAAV